MEISKTGLKLIKHYESLHDGDLFKIGLQPKMDPSGIWTILYGHALKNPETGEWLQGEEDFKLVEKFYPKFMNMTLQQAEEFLEEDLLPTEHYLNHNFVNEYIHEQWEYDALCSFIYNVGLGNFMNSTLFKRIKNRVSDELIRDAFLMWKFSEGKVLDGLISRRKSEAYLFCKGSLKFYN